MQHVLIIIPKHMLPGQGPAIGPVGNPRVFDLLLDLLQDLLSDHHAECIMQHLWKIRSCGWSQRPISGRNNKKIQLSSVWDMDRFQKVHKHPSQRHWKLYMFMFSKFSGIGTWPFRHVVGKWGGTTCRTTPGMVFGSTPLNSSKSTKGKSGTIHFCDFQFVVQVLGHPGKWLGDEVIQLICFLIWAPISCRKAWTLIQAIFQWILDGG